MSYIRSNYGCNLFHDNSWKRFQRFHSGGDVNIFLNHNFGYNHYGCGCGHMGFCNFSWGAAIGLGVCNFIGSLYTGFMNCMGMFDAFGNNGMWNPIGMSNSYSGYSSTRNNATTSVNLVDKDAQKIADLQEEVNNLANKDTITQEDIDALKTKITDARGTSDNYNVEANNKSYDELLKQLDKLKGRVVTDAGKKKDDIGKQVQERSAVAEANPVAIDQIATEDEFLANINDIADLTSVNIDHLSSEEAKQVLAKLGLMYSDNTAKMSVDPMALLLLQKAGVVVKCAKNNKTELSDPYLQGKISDLQVSVNGEITFTIDNNIDGAAFKYKYTFKGKDGKFKLIKIDKNGQESAYMINNWKDREYIFNNDILEITDAPLIKQKVANGYTQI